MSQRFRNSRPSAKPRLLRPRAARASNPGSVPPSEAPSSSDDRESLEIGAASESLPPVEPRAVEPAPAVEAAPPPKEAILLPPPVALPEPPAASSNSVASAPVVAKAAPIEEGPVEAAPVEAAPVEAAPVEAPRAPATPPAKIEAAPTSIGGKKKKKKKKGQEAASQSVPPQAAAKVEPVLEAKTTDAAKALGDSGKHKNLGESGKFNAAFKDDEHAFEFFSTKPPPVAMDDDLDDDVLAAAPPPPPSPEVLRRKQMLRKVVGGVVVAASLVFVVGVGRALFGSKAADAQTPTHAVATQAMPQPTAESQAEAPKPATDPAADAKVADAKAADAKAEEDKKAADAKAEEDQKAADAKAEEDKKAADATSAVSADELKDLKKKVTSAINRGATKETIELGTKALAADPEDALIYMYVGSSYMDQGKLAEAYDTFAACVEKAKGPHVGECKTWAASTKGRAKK